MDLINYLAENFYTKETLLELSKVSRRQFDAWQNERIVPQASYKLSINAECQSFFGDHEETLQIEYYAKGYISWLAIVQCNPTQAACYADFYQRYVAEVNRLAELGFVSDKAELNVEIDRHIESEWQHFLNGTYGLCTTTGLPEEIAAKELAIAIINELLEDEIANESDLKTLANAVSLLDRASSSFAPHERVRSTRFRLIDEVRRKYRLPAN
mgnify:CR=1 FL=1